MIEFINSINSKFQFRTIHLLTKWFFLIAWPTYFCQSVFYVQHIQLEFGKTFTFACFLCSLKVMFWPGTGKTFWRRSFTKDNLCRIIPVLVVFYRVVMVCHVDFCCRHGEKTIRDRLVRSFNFQNWIVIWLTKVHFHSLYLGCVLVFPLLWLYFH